MRVLPEEYRGIMSFITLSSKLVQRKQDCPNAHWLLRLYKHSAPLFGRALFFSELNLESNYLILKSALSKRIDSPGHIESMYDAHCKDWLNLSTKTGQSTIMKFLMILTRLDLLIDFFFSPTTVVC